MNPKSKLYFKCGPWKARKNPWKIEKKKKRQNDPEWPWIWFQKITRHPDLKTHIETGNIYYKNNDTNESIFEFMKNQQDSSKGKINFNLMYDGNYNDYFRWILNGFDTYEKTKLDLLTFKNTKY